MKILVTGITGQLGYDVVRELSKTNHIVIATGRSNKLPNNLNDIQNSKIMYYKMDISDPENVRAVIYNVKPDIIIHCAAWTDVDGAQENSNLAYQVNEIGTKNLAKCARHMKSKFIYISTDYVFEGNGNKPYVPLDLTNPLSVYGMSKLKGEKIVLENIDKHFILRISWVFGINGNNFIKTMINVGKKHKDIRVVNDQIGRPTYTVDLAKLIIEMLESENYGVYHATNQGEYISWFDFAKEIFRKSKINVNVLPVSTQEYGLSIARRPFNSRLDNSKLEENGFTKLPNWENALERFLNEYNLMGKEFENE